MQSNHVFFSSSLYKPIQNHKKQLEDSRLRENDMKDVIPAKAGII